MHCVVIVGTGQSVLDLNKPDLSELINSDHNLQRFRKVSVIAVNGAHDWLKPDQFTDFFTLDPSFANVSRLWSLRPGIKYHLARSLGKHIPMPEKVKVYNRVSVTTDPNIVEKDSPEWWLRRWSSKTGLSEDPSCIHTGNSMYGALGLAYHWRPSKILLLGLDGTTEPRVNDEGPSKGSLKHLPLLFSSAVQQLNHNNIQVVVGNPNSAVGCFRRTTVKEGMEWIAR